MRNQRRCRGDNPCLPRRISPAPPFFPENGNIKLAAANFIYDGTLAGLPATVTLSAPAFTADRDTIEAEYPVLFVLPDGNQIVYATAEFTETGNTTNLFRNIQRIPGKPGTSTENWKIAKVENLGGSGKGTYYPFKMRVKGLTSSEKYYGRWDEHESRLLPSQFEPSSGWYYLEGGSDKVATLVDKEGELWQVSYDKKTSKITAKKVSSEDIIEGQITGDPVDQIKKWLRFNELSPLAIELSGEIDKNGYAYINVIPEMPKLKARLRPEKLPGDAIWELKIEFKRPNRKDEDTLPKVKLKADVEWDITPDFKNQFYGGKAILRAEYRGYIIERAFHIRGKNPPEKDVEAEIGDYPFYAKAIARHESGRQTDSDTKETRTYLQFNIAGSLGPDYNKNVKDTPNRSPDLGWGIYQITHLPLPTRDQLWDWKANVAEGKRRMIHDLEVDAPSYFKAVERKHPNEYEPPPDYTAPGTNTKLTAIQAAAIQMFNGSSVREELPTPYGGTDWYRSCWKFHPNKPSGQRWEFVPNKNDYVTIIMKEYERK